MKIQGKLKIKRKMFWAERYGRIIDNRFEYFKNKDSPSPRGWLNLEDCQIRSKLVLPNDKVILISQLAQKRDTHNKLSKT